MANGTKAIERNEEPEIAVRCSVSNPPAAPTYIRRMARPSPTSSSRPGERADHDLRLLVANPIILLRR